jgi:hypothetical protein
VAPIDRALVEPSLLTTEESRRLNDDHARARHDHAAGGLQDGGVVEGLHGADLMILAVLLFLGRCF